MEDFDLAFLNKRPGLVGREGQLTRCVPEYLSYRSVLYIGARPSRMQIIDLFHDAGYVIDILEIFRPNVMRLLAMNQEIKWFRRIVEGDVRAARRIMDEIYDVVFWWHGPEHVAKGELAKVTAELELMARALVIMGCPHGDVKQGVSYGNVHEIHRAALFAADFEALGYQTDVRGVANKGGSNILSWKRLGR
jgi:hypothetical protein